jgi:hypothetical protein
LRLAASRDKEGILELAKNEPVGCAGFLLGDAKHSKIMGGNDGEAGPDFVTGTPKFDLTL